MKEINEWIQKNNLGEGRTKVIEYSVEKEKEDSQKNPSLNS